MAVTYSSTIDIVTTNGRYKALREGDPIWSGFLPDASITKNNKEYIVSESVSAAIDSQWEAYNRLVAYLDAVGYICVERATRDSKISDDILSRAVTYTRRELLEKPTSSRWLTSSTADRSIMNGCHYVMYRGLGTRVGIVVYDPTKLVYYDEVDRIGYLLNLPDGWEYWVPVRGISPNHTNNPEVTRRDRIRHTIKAGRIVQPITKEIEIESGPQELDRSVIYSQLNWSHYENHVGTLPDWFGGVRDYLTRVAHLATIAMHKNAAHHGPSDRCGIVWDDVHYVLSTRQYSECVPRYTRYTIRVPPDIGTAFVGGYSPTKQRIDPVPLPLLGLVALYDIESCPDDVDIVDIGLSKIITGDHAQTRRPIACVVEQLIQRYYRFESLRECKSYPDGKRSITQYLRDNLPRGVIAKFISVLEHYISTNHCKMRKSAEQFLGQLQDLGKTEGLCEPDDNWWSLEDIPYSEVLILPSDQQKCL